MADDTLSFAAGLVIGIVVVALIIWIVKQQQADGQMAGSPDMTQYSVNYDDEGRIKNVHSMRNLPLDGGQAPPTRSQVGPNGHAQEPDARARN